MESNNIYYFSMIGILRKLKKYTENSYHRCVIIYLFNRSARMLYKLAQDGFKPTKLFSIDRVFRNENLDATHLAEFH